MNCMEKKTPVFIACWNIIFLLTLLPMQAYASSDDLSLSALKESVQKLHSIQTTFTQTTKNPMFSTQLVSKGNFAFQRPDKLLWEYTSPFVEGFAINGSEAAKWKKQKTSAVTFATASDPLTQLLATELIHWITLDLNWIESSYAVTVISTTPTTLKLIPKQQAVNSIIDYLLITFSKQGVAKSVVIQEQSSQGTTTIVFSDIRVNPSLPITLFRP